MSRSVYETVRSAVAAARRVGLDSTDQRMAARVVLLAGNADLTPDIVQLLVDEIYLDISQPKSRSAQVIW